MITQLSFLPDNDQAEPTVKGGVPLVKLVNGRWCWLVPGTTCYEPEPELERVLLAALAAAEQKKAT